MAAASAATKATATVAPVRLATWQHCRSNRNRLDSSGCSHFVLRSLKLQPITFIACIQSSNISSCKCNISNCSTNSNSQSQSQSNWLALSISHSIHLKLFDGSLIWRPCSVLPRYLRSTSIISGNCGTLTMSAGIAGVLYWPFVASICVGLNGPWVT